MYLRDAISQSDCGLAEQVGDGIIYVHNGSTDFIYDIAKDKITERLNPIGLDDYAWSPCNDPSIYRTICDHHIKGYPVMEPEPYDLESTFLHLKDLFSMSDNNTQRDNILNEILRITNIMHPPIASVCDTPDNVS